MCPAGVMLSLCMARQWSIWLQCAQASPVFDLGQARAPLQVAHEQVLHGAVGATRQQHGDGLPVVAIAVLGLQEAQAELSQDTVCAA